jgi:hypothetical protein
MKLELLLLKSMMKRQLMVLKQRKRLRSLVSQKMRKRSQMKTEMAFLIGQIKSQVKMTTHNES